MCGIFVVPKTINQNKLDESFNQISRRGPDQSKKLVTSKHLFMFHRLSIMGISETGMQPFVRGRNILVTNGEIYNYKKLLDHMNPLELTSESDCEVLLPLYEKFGVEMFSMLDAEFVTIIYDGEKDQIIAARDPIGIRPLFFGYTEHGDIAFASEVKSLIEITEKVYPFPPGHYYMNGVFTSYMDIYPSTYSEDDLPEILTNIHDKLIDGVQKRLQSDQPIGYLLSGGLDSSLVCAIAQKMQNKPIETFAIGMDKDAIDLKYAKIVADYIGSNHHEVIMTKDDVLSSLEEVIRVLETFDITTIRASIGMYLVAKYIHLNTNIKVLLTGEVSDELFGYKYTDYAPNPEAFQKESVKRIEELYMYDVLRADRTISCHSLEARVPFADKAFVKYVLAINPKYKINTYQMGKYLLRKAFEKDNLLPASILYRDKAAFSDAVGHSMVDDLKEFAENHYSDEEFMNRKLKYQEHQPISKESLLYREIFEKYYPKHAHLINGFWMPNSEWEGLKDVKDPSARVLKNYGKSGE